MSNPRQAETLKLLYARLSADVDIAAIVSTRVYNQIPEPVKNIPVRPYIRFFLVSAVDWGTKNELAYEMEVQVDCWSEWRGDKQALEMVDAVIAATHNQPLSLANGQNILMQHAGTNIIDEQDGLNHHGVVRLRLLTGQS